MVSPVNSTWAAASQSFCVAVAIGSFSFCVVATLSRNPFQYTLDVAALSYVLLAIIGIVTSHIHGARRGFAATLVASFSYSASLLVTERYSAVHPIALTAWWIIPHLTAWYPVLTGMLAVAGAVVFAAMGAWPAVLTIIAGFGLAYLADQAVQKYGPSTMAPISQFFRTGAYPIAAVVAAAGHTLFFGFVTGAMVRHSDTSFASTSGSVVTLDLIMYHCVSVFTTNGPMLQPKSCLATCVIIVQMASGFFITIVYFARLLSSLESRGPSDGTNDQHR